MSKTGYFNPPNGQRFFCRTLKYVSLLIITRAVTGTGQTIRVLLNGTAQVCADQTQGYKSALIMNQKSWNFRDIRPGIKWIIRCQTNVEIRFGGRLTLEIQESDQAA